MRHPHHSNPNKKGIKIYKKTWHLAVTLLVVFLPFAFFLAFSKLAKLNSADLFYDLGISVLRLLIAYLISAVIAWFLGVYFYKGKAETIGLPIFDVLQSFPTFAILPLATLFFGPSETTIIFFLVITVVWPIFFTVVSSLKLLRQDWEEAVKIYQLKGRNFFKYYLWPASLPGLITGSVIGLGEGWEALVATEIIVGKQDGLGSFFHEFSSNPTITSFGVLGLLMLIFSLNKLIWLPLLEWSHRHHEE